MDARVNVRVSTDTLKRIDELARRESQRQPKGRKPLGRSEMIRILLDKAIGTDRKT